MDQASVAPGATVTFTLVASANFDADTVSLVDAFPPGLTATGVSDGAESPACSLNATTNTVTCDWSTLAADTPLTVTINATSAVAGEYINNATLSAANVDPAISQDVPVVFQVSPSSSCLLVLHFRNATCCLLAQLRQLVE